MLDAIEELKETKEEIEQAKIKNRFSFRLMVEEIIRRQRNEKDTIICVIGERRNGKSNWVLKIVREYIRQKKAKDKNFKWSWDGNFAKTRSEAIEKIDKLPKGSFIVFDEAGDVAYRGDTIQARQKQLIKFLLKSGEKLLFTVFTLPDILLLDPKILNMCLYMIAVPYRYRKVCAFGFIYGRSANPFIHDKFGVHRIKLMFQSKKSNKMAGIPSLSHTVKIKRGNEIVEVPYPYQLFRFMRTLPTFLHMHKFGRCDVKFENLYIKHVKSKQLTIQEKDDFINMSEYRKLQHRYNALLYNLFTRQGMSIAQLERLHIEPKTGKLLIARETIRKRLDSISARFE